VGGDMLDGLLEGSRWPYVVVTGPWGSSLVGERKREESRIPHLAGSQDVEV